MNYIEPTSPLGSYHHIYADISAIELVINELSQSAALSQQVTVDLLK